MQFNDKVKGSFTLEATFVVTIILWIVFSLCYLSLLSHDQVVLYSGGQKCLRENYREEQSREVIQKQLFILKINKVVCKENVLKKKMTVTEFEQWSRMASELRDKAIAEEIPYEQYYEEIRK